MISHSENETAAFGKELSKSFKSGDIVAFHGDLGAGKTALIKGIIEELTAIPSREVQSPTFVYLNIYPSKIPIYHFDLYRLENSEGFLQKGFLDYLGDQGICLIEWAERIAPLLPPKTIHIQLKQLEEGKRKIDVYKSRVHSLCCET